jgi:hypothetical protein
MSVRAFFLFAGIFALSACTHEFADADIDNVKKEIRSEFAKRHLAVVDDSGRCRSLLRLSNNFSTPKLR